MKKETHKLETCNSWALIEQLTQIGTSRWQYWILTNLSWHITWNALVVLKNLVRSLKYFREPFPNCVCQCFRTDLNRKSTIFEYLRACPKDNSLLNLHVQELNLSSSICRWKFMTKKHIFSIAPIFLIDPPRLWVSIFPFNDTPLNSVFFLQTKSFS